MLCSGIFLSSHLSLLCLLSLETTVPTSFSDHFLHLNKNTYPMKIGVFFYFFSLAVPYGLSGILAPRPGIKPRPSAVRARSPNNWTPGKSLKFFFKMKEIVSATTPTSHHLSISQNSLNDAYSLCALSCLPIYSLHTQPSSLILEPPRNGSHQILECAFCQKI